MKLILERAYGPEGTNGALYREGLELICHTIELPWRDNRQRESCIPEGTYRLEAAYSRRLGKVLTVGPVPGRSGILIHPANNALRELKGCIAPVLTLDGPGLGAYSRAALQQLLLLLLPAFRRGEQALLTIKKQAA